jgi:hypothetical protein
MESTEPRNATSIGGSEAPLFPEQTGSATVYSQVCHMLAPVSVWTGGAKNLLKKTGGGEMRLAFGAALGIQR